VTLRIGTRRSRLALAQANEISELLRRDGVETETVPIVTSGDRGAPASASPTGVKGLFVAEIASALQRGEIDLAVHSAKDLPAEDPDGLVIAAVPQRADARDILVQREEGRASVVGTSSVRRRAQLLRRHPDTSVVDVRGNVDTRLAKLESGEVEALVLASAGLQRLGMRRAHSRALDAEEMVPAPGQGALAVQARSDDDFALEMLGSLEHRESRRAFDAERRLMALIGGGCALPLGALAETTADGGVRLRAVVVSPEGSELVDASATDDDPERAAELVAEQLLKKGAGAILAQAREEAP